MTGGKRLGHLLMWAGFVTSAFVATSRTEAMSTGWPTPSQPLWELLESFCCA